MRPIAERRHEKGLKHGGTAMLKALLSVRCENLPHHWKRVLLEIHDAVPYQHRESPRDLRDILQDAEPITKIEGLQ